MCDLPCARPRDNTATRELQRASWLNKRELNLQYMKQNDTVEMTSRTRQSRSRSRQSDPEDPTGRTNEQNPRSPALVRTAAADDAFQQGPDIRELGKDIKEGTFVCVHVYDNRTDQHPDTSEVNKSRKWITLTGVWHITPKSNYNGTDEAYHLRVCTGPRELIATGVTYPSTMGLSLIHI